MCAGVRELQLEVGWNLNFDEVVEPWSRCQWLYIPSYYLGISSPIRIRMLDIPNLEQKIPRYDLRMRILKSLKPISFPPFKQLQ
jgi:hypothetical protein